MSAKQRTADSGFGEPTQTNEKDREVSNEGEEDWDDDATEIDSQDREKLLAAESLIQMKSVPEPNTWDQVFGNLSLALEPLEVEEKSTQTDLLFPSEDTEKAAVALKNVEILRGLLLFQRVAYEKRESKRKSCAEVLLTGSTSSNLLPAGTWQPNKRYKQSQMEQMNFPNSEPVVAADFSQRNTPMMFLLLPRKRPSSETEHITNESLRYSLRQHSLANRSAKSFRQLLDFVAEECVDGAIYVADNWTCSLVATATETLLATADIAATNSGDILTKLTDRLINAISNEIGFNQAKLQESRVHIVLKLCESTVVSMGVINAILLKLLLVRESLVDEESVPEQQIQIFETTPYLLYIAVKVLRVLEDKFESGEVLSLRPSSATVLNLWRRHWLQESHSTSQPKSSSVLPIWYQELHQVLQVVTTRAPIFAPSVLDCRLIIEKMLKRETV